MITILSCNLQNFVSIYKGTCFLERNIRYTTTRKSYNDLYIILYFSNSTIVGCVLLCRLYSIFVRSQVYRNGMLYISHKNEIKIILYLTNIWSALISTIFLCLTYQFRVMIIISYTLSLYQ